MSYIYPVSLRRGGGAVNRDLKIYLYRNQLQLTTPDAFYSDGSRYRPAVEAAKYLKSALPGMQSVLALGGGLGSIIRVLHGKGYRPKVTMVEIDKVVLEWAMEALGGDAGYLDPVCTDARLFMERNTRKFDFIFVDVFNGRVVPEFVCSVRFLEQCRSSLSPSGRLALNYIINDQAKWEALRASFTAVFPGAHIISIDINRILVSAASTSHIA